MKAPVGIKVFPLLLLVFFIFPAETLFGQSHILSGKITDERNRQPLAFVNVVINDGQQVVISDIDGRYSITANEPITKVKFSSIGYEPKEIALQADQKKCNVALRPMTFELGEVTVEAGENPAHRIIDSLMAHRKANNPSSLDSYSYNIYDKMVITIDSSSFGQAVANDTAMEMTNLHYFDSIMKKSDLMVMETASEVLFMAPDRKLQHVLGTKISGMKEPSFMYLVNSMQSVSFYDETVNITGTDYVNPISRGSKTRYFFTLESTHPIGQGDSLYVISFHPMRGSSFNGLRGTMTVNSDGWALQSVKAAPDTQSGLFTADIQQPYQKVEGQWFPKQLNLNLIFPSMVVSMDNSTFPMAAVGKSYLDEIKINPDISKRQFSDIEIKVDPDAAYRDETFWDAQRIDSLTERVKATYILVDSLTQGTDIFDRVLGLTDKLLTESALPIGCFNLDLDHIINYSTIRGWYFGLGLSTNDKMLKWMRLKGFFGYYTRIKFINYSAGVDFLLSQKKQTKLSLTFHNRQVSTSSFDRFAESDFVLDPMNYKYSFYEPYYAQEMAGKVELSSRLFAGLKGFASFTYGERSYLQDLDTMAYLLVNDSITYLKHRHAELELKLRFAFKEKFASTPYGLQSLGTRWPIVWLSYSHSFANVWGSLYSFDRLMLQAHDYFYTKHIGVSFVMLQAGMTLGNVPIGEMITPLGSHAVFGIYSPGCFNTMRGNEFYCDRFVALYWAHNFGSTLWHINSSWFQPEPVIITNIGWGCITDEQHKGLPTMDKGYFESGLMFNGIINISLVKLGFGAFYRYGPYSFNKTWDNFSLKWYAVFNL